MKSPKCKNCGHAIIKSPIFGDYEHKRKPDTEDKCSVECRFCGCKKPELIGVKR